MQDFEFVVIGGGIVGLSVAWAIMEGTPSARLVVIEKESHMGSSSDRQEQRGHPFRHLL